jgi:hypothetical protein
MSISNDMLLGLVSGVILVLLFQQAMKLSSRLMSPGCLIPIGLVFLIFSMLVVGGVIDFQWLG